jgi:AraC-like DNA-binding protein
MSTHGILNPGAGRGNFALERVAPSADLAWLVERYWLISWDLRGRETFAQETLPHPCVNVVIGTHRPGVGLGTKRFVAELEGRGWVLGVKFRSGAFHALYRRDVAELAGRERSIESVFGEDGGALEASVLARGGGTACIESVEQFLRARRPARDENIDTAARAVEVARADPSIGRTRDLASRVELSPRTLERLFHRYVGVSPKWIIRRYRVHEACERAASGEAPSWSELAQELGYFDQAHFIRDFKAQVGRTPAQYAKLCASARLTTWRSSNI